VIEEPEAGVYTDARFEKENPMKPALFVAFSLFASLASAAPGLDPDKRSIAMPFTEPQTLDPQRADDAFAQIVLSHALESLVRADQNETIIPGAAESWTQDSPTKFTFKLRKGSVWSDGVPVKADDFVFSWQRAVDPKTAAPGASSYYVVKNGLAVNTGKLAPDQLGIKALDERTLVVELENPTPYFLPMLAACNEFQPSRRDVVEKFGEAYAADAEKLVFNGPFTVSHWAHSASLTLTKNERYWNKDQIQLNEIRMILVPDHRTAYNMVKTGQLAIVRSMPTHLAREAQKDGLQVRHYNHGSIYAFDFNTKRGLSANKHVRKAVQYAINRREFVDKVDETPGMKPSARPIPDYMPGVKQTYAKEHPVQWPDAQLDKAKAELELARKELGVETLPPLTIMASDSEVVRRDVEYFQAYLKTSIGLEVKTDFQAFKVTMDRSDRGDYEVAIFSSGPDVLDPVTFLESFTSFAPGYDTWSTPAYDALMKRAATEADPAKRFATLFEAESMLIEEAPTVPIMQSTRVYVVDPRLTGVLRRVVGADPDFYYARIEPKLASAPAKKKN